MNPTDNVEALLRILDAPRRNKFFYGKRMDVQHFTMEQNYGKYKQWLLNRLALGKGVMCGLRVSVQGNLVCVDPGVAIDGLGREIIVPVRTCVDPTAPDTGCCGGTAAGATVSTLVPGSPPAAIESPPAPAPIPAPVVSPPAAAAAPATAGGRTARSAAARAAAAAITTAVPGPTPAAASAPAAAAPTSGPALAVAAGAAAPAPAAAITQGLYTLWLCYRECQTDFQPVVVSECGTRDECSAGTIVETFCLKLVPGHPPFLGDPTWCAKLWGQPVSTGGTTAGASGPAPSVSFTELTATPLSVAGASAGSSLTVADVTAVMPARTSRRHILCELFDGTCDPIEGDACVPLALVLLRDGQIAVESCLVRPRIYSNQQLLDLILCLAEKIDACCNALLRVVKVDFLARTPPAGEKVVASVQSPLVSTSIKYGSGFNAIRIKFSKALATDQHKPTTPNLNDRDYQVHNVQILADGGDLPYVPGTLTLEAPDTVRFDVVENSPYSHFNQWLPGTYHIFLRGTEDLANKRQALADTSDIALDGEPIAPVGGFMSGNGVPGGDFTASFSVLG